MSHSSESWKGCGNSRSDGFASFMKLIDKSVPSGSSRSGAVERFTNRSLSNSAGLDAGVSKSINLHRQADCDISTFLQLRKR